jgi:transcriptional regulator with XRE-family HTH domain
MQAETLHMQRMAHTLRRARTAAHLSLRQLAAKAGTSHSTLLAYEKGRKAPAVTTFFRILEACGQAVDVQLSPRVRERDGLPRGEELREVLELADAFPVRKSLRLDCPRFGSRV